MNCQEFGRAFAAAELSELAEVARMVAGVKMS